MLTKTSVFLGAAALVALSPLSVNAHMIMANPVPFNHPNNSPLAGDGSNFPCKGPPSGSAQVNEWPAGSTQSLSFTGTAVHGGGSCQISVTTDKAPTKDSKWKVIHSIEGGCPADTAGNFQESGPSFNGSFPFTVPKDLPNGDMAVAWTWFNKVGNREFYMNCGSVSVTGGADGTSGLDALPDMAIANLNVPGSCGTTKEGSDYTFPNPGSQVTKGGKGPFVDLCGGTPSQPGVGSGSGSTSGPTSGSGPGSGSNSGSGAGSGSSSGSSSGSGSCPGSSTITSQPPTAPSASAQPSTLRTIKTVTAPMSVQPTNTGGVMAPSASSAAPAAPKLTAQPSSAGPAPTAPTAPAASPAPAPVAGGTSCSTDGEIICSADGTQFGICNFGKAVMMPVAGGTKCVNKAIGKRHGAAGSYFEYYAHRNQRTAV